jgi:hypothetical protein
MIKYKEWQCTLHIVPFVANKRKNKCIILNDAEDGMQVTKANVFLEGLEPNQVAIDTNNCGYEMVKSLQDAGVIGEKAVAARMSGYCTYPVYELIGEYNK